MMVDADAATVDPPVVRREKAIPRGERMDATETEEVCRLLIVLFSLSLVF